MSLIADNIKIDVVLMVNDTNTLLKKQSRGCGLDSFGSGYGSVVGCCENDNEPLGCVKDEEITD